MMQDLFTEHGKICPYCGREREWWQFYRSRSSKDGLQSYCKDCQRRYREKHPTKEYKHHGKDLSLKLWEQRT